MKHSVWVIVAGLAWAGTGLAQSAGIAADEGTPLRLMQQYESIYAPPALPGEAEGYNAGAVHGELEVSYFTDYVFRGIERFDAAIQAEDALNLQFNGKLSFDLGKPPHPFIGLFANVAEMDPVSNFQEVRPYFGADWTIRPLTLTAGHANYLFPNRKELDSAEAFVKLTVDDSYFSRADEPFFSPYVLAAYDYDLYNGWYVEAGVEHNFRLEQTGIVLTAQASVAYVRDMSLFAGPQGDENGFHHYRLGLIGRYSLNNLLNIPRRYGEWSIVGYLFYTDGLNNRLRADTELWGGGGIGFSY